MKKSQLTYAVWPWGTKTREQAIEAARDITEIGFTAFESVKAAMYAFDLNVEEYKAMRTEKNEGSYQHLENSLKIFKALEEKALRFDYEFQKKCVAERDYEKLELYVNELLMGLK